MHINKKAFLAGFVFGVFFLVDSHAFAQVACQRVVINEKGTSNANITINNTAGGILIADANSNRCSLVIHNNGANVMTCGPATITVSATAGFIVGVGGVLSFDSEGKEAWRCFSDTGTTAQVVESKP